MYISEFTREAYRNEYGLVNFTHYTQKTKGADVSKNLTLLKNMLSKIRELHNLSILNSLILEISHLNLSANNIYFNTTNEVFLGPIKLQNYEENELWYSAPEISFIEEDNIHNIDLLKCDIWSIGCIITELFFVSTPLFHSFSIKDKIRKMIEVYILLI